VALSSGWIFRAGILLLLGGWISFSPAYRQVFNGRSKWFPRWVMFHGFGRNVCDVQFFQIVPDDEGGEQRKALDRFEVLDRKRSWSKNKSIVRMGSKTEVERVGKRICRALGPNADVRAHARCGSRDTWKRKLRGKSNLCTLTPDTIKGGKKLK